MDFKFASHGLWSEKQNVLLQHMHKKEFGILTNKCGNNLKHGNEAEWPWLFSYTYKVENRVSRDVLTGKVYYCNLNAGRI